MNLEFDIPNDIEMTDIEGTIRRQAMEYTQRVWEITNTMPDHQTSEIRHLYRMALDGWMESTRTATEYADIARATLCVVQNVLREQERFLDALNSADIRDPAIANYIEPLLNQLRERAQEEIIEDISSALDGASNMIVIAILATLRGQQVSGQYQSVVIEALKFYISKIEEEDEWQQKNK